MITLAKSPNGFLTSVVPEKSYSVATAVSLFYWNSFRRPTETACELLSGFAARHQSVLITYVINCLNVLSQSVLGSQHSGTKSGSCNGKPFGSRFGVETSAFWMLHSPAALRNPSILYCTFYPKGRSFSPKDILKSLRFSKTAFAVAFSACIPIFLS